MPDIITWPAALLTPQSSPFNPRPFSRSDGRTLGGIRQAIRTDRGYWAGSYQGVVFRRGNADQRRTWNALRVALTGSVGLVAVPVCSSDLWTGYGLKFGLGMTHDDDTPFADTSLYTQDAADLSMGADATLGATVVTLSCAIPNISGIRFSWHHAMYETGRILSEPGEGLYQVEIFPAIRAPIPAGESLETERPTVLCHLASDSEMDLDLGVSRTPRPTVNFVEAVDYWNQLALGMVD